MMFVLAAQNRTVKEAVVKGSPKVVAKMCGITERSNLLGLNDDSSANYYLDPKTLSRFVKKIQEEKEKAASVDSSPQPNEKRKWYRSGAMI